MIFNSIVKFNHLNINIECSDSKIVRLTINSPLQEENPNNISRLVKFQLDAYFKKNLVQFDLPFEFTGTEFQNKVWKELLNVPFGKTISYQEMAERIGSPKSARAVGNALNKNPIPIIVPCHRVLAKNGLGGFAPGVSFKKVLLEIES